jgi:hypothetical protein
MRAEYFVSAPYLYRRTCGTCLVVADRELEGDCHGHRGPVEGRRPVAVLVDSREDAAVSEQIGGFDHLHVYGFAGFIDGHIDGDGAILSEGALEDVVGIDLDGADKLGRCDTGGDASRGSGSGCVVSRCDGSERGGLKVAGLKEGRRTGLSWRFRLCMHHDRSNR